MQGSFGDIYNKLYDRISQDAVNINNISDDYDTITSEEVAESEFSLISSMSENNLSTKIEHAISNKMAMFDINQYLDKIAETFNYNPNKILEQFTLDFHRSELYFEGKSIRNQEFFISTIKNKFDYETNYHNMKMYDMILMLCNQASFAFPFVIINNIYSNYKKGIFVVSNNIKYLISTNNEDLYIELAGTFNIKNINTNKIKGKIDINTKIDLNFKNNKYIFPKLGIVYWQ